MLSEIPEAQRDGVIAFKGSSFPEPAATSSFTAASGTMSQTPGTLDLPPATANILQRKPMIISVASGKGGTGKTTIATSLAAVLGPRGMLVDCDVEEPNCHLFMNPNMETHEDVNLLVPEVDSDKCSLCGKCCDGNVGFRSNISKNLKH